MNGTGTNSGTTRVWLSSVRAELCKVFTLPVWWIGCAVIILLSLYYAYSGAGLAADGLASLKDGMVLDESGNLVSLTHYLSGVVLSAPYQSMVMFFPLFLAIICGQEYRDKHAQLIVSRLAVPSRMRLAAAKMIVAVLLALLVTIVLFVLSDAVLLMTLPKAATSVIASAWGLLILPRIMLFAMMMALVAGAIVALLQSTIGALITVVVFFLLSLSDILRAFGSWAVNIMPMVGAKTFLFGYHQQQDEASATTGVIVLAAWLIVAIATWLFAAWKHREA